MADVQSTATLSINVQGEDQVKSLAQSLNEIKTSAGEAGSSVGELGPQIGRTRDEVNSFIKSQREARWAAQETAGATAQMSSATDEASASAAAGYGTLRDYTNQLIKAQRDVTFAERGYGDLAEAQQKLTEVQAAGAAYRPAEAIAAAAPAAAVPPGAAPPGAAAAMPGLADAASAAGFALVGLGAAAGVAKAAMEGFKVASEAAAASSRDILATTASAMRAGVEFDQAQRDRMAGIGLFGEAGLQRTQDAITRSMREGGKGLAKDLETIGLEPGAAPPTPVEFARRAAARREELSRAISEAPTEEARAAAQSTMNEFASALRRRGGRDVERVAMELNEADVQARIDAAQKTADAFRRNIEPQQLQDQARSLERSQAQLKQSQDQAWNTFGEAATPGVTALTDQLNKSFQQQAPAMSAAGGAMASGLASGAANYLGAKSTQWDMWGNMVQGVKGLFGATPAQAAEAITPPAPPPAPPVEAAPPPPPPPPAEMPKIEPPPPEELPKIQIEPAGLEQIASAGEAFGTSLASSLGQLSATASEAGATFGTAASAGIAEAGSAGGSTFSSTASAGITEAGSSGGTAFSSAAQAGITAAGSAGGAAFAAAINPGSIGSAIGAAAAAAISAAKVNVNVNVAGAGGGGGTGGGATTGKDSPS